MSNITVKLFRADWCVHCRNFCDTWDKLTSDKELSKVVHFKKYEDEDRENRKDVDKEFKDCGVTSYPTIIIEKDGNKISYEGKRDFEVLKDYFLKVADGTVPMPNDDKLMQDDEGDDDEPMQGGGIDYKYKYEKYKSKYEALKKKLQKNK